MGENTEESGADRGIKAKNEALVLLQAHAVAAAQTLIDIMDNAEMPTRERRFSAVAILDRVGIVAGVHVEATGKDGAPLGHLSFEQLVAVIKGANSNRR